MEAGAIWVRISAKSSLGADLAKAGAQLQGWQGQMNSVGVKMQSFGANMTKYVGLPIVAIGGLSVKAAIDFESAFAGVRKTVDATEEEFAALESGIRNMAKEIPASASAISAVAEAAGQLGIETPNILSFTRTMVDLGETTNLSATEAASALARLANITQMPQDQFDRLGSVIVALGNNMATTEAEIVEMGLRLAGAGNQVGMTEAQILGMAAALSSVGIEAEAGGSAFSKVMANMQLAVEKGGKSLDDFASVAGMSAKEFQAAFKEDAAGAIVAFVAGLGTAEERGVSAIKVLDDMGITEVRLRDALLRAAGAGDLLNESLALGTKAWDENNALTEEANKRYETTAAKLSILKNKLVDMGISIGEGLIPVVTKAGTWFEKMIGAIKGVGNAMPDAVKGFAAWGAAMAAVIGPMTWLIGKGVSGIAHTAHTLGNFAKSAIDATKAVGTFAYVYPGATAGLTAIATVGVAGGLALDYFADKLSNSEGWVAFEKYAAASAKQAEELNVALAKIGDSVDTRGVEALAKKFEAVGVGAEQSTKMAKLALGGYKDEVLASIETQEVFFQTLLERGEMSKATFDQLKQGIESVREALDDTSSSTKAFDAILAKFGDTNEELAKVLESDWQDMLSQIKAVGADMIAEGGKIPDYIIQTWLNSEGKVKEQYGALFEGAFNAMTEKWVIQGEPDLENMKRAMLQILNDPQSFITAAGNDARGWFTEWFTTFGLTPEQTQEVVTRILQILRIEGETGSAGEQAGEEFGKRLNERLNAWYSPISGTVAKILALFQGGGPTKADLVNLGLSQLGLGGSGGGAPGSLIGGFGFLGEGNTEMQKSIDRLVPSLTNLTEEYSGLARAEKELEEQVDKAKKGGASQSRIEQLEGELEKLREVRQARQEEIRNIESLRSTISSLARSWDSYSKVQKEAILEELEHQRSLLLKNDALAGSEKMVQDLDVAIQNLTKSTALSLDVFEKQSTLLERFGSTSEELEKITATQFDLMIDNVRALGRELVNTIGTIPAELLNEWAGSTGKMREVLLNEIWAALTEMMEVWQKAGVPVTQDIFNIFNDLIWRTEEFKAAAGSDPRGFFTNWFSQLGLAPNRVKELADIALGMLGIKGFATGGIAWTPQLAMVAERGPELITPLADLTSGRSGGGIGAGLSLNNCPITVYANDPMELSRKLAQEATLRAAITGVT